MGATFSKFEYKHLLYLEDNLEEARPTITNPKQYFLTSIYNVVKTYGIAESGLINQRE